MKFASDVDRFGDKSSAIAKTPSLPSCCRQCPLAQPIDINTERDRVSVTGRLTLFCSDGTVTRKLRTSGFA